MRRLRDWLRRKNRLLVSVSVIDDVFIIKTETDLDVLTEKQLENMVRYLITWGELQLGAIKEYHARS